MTSKVLFYVQHLLGIGHLSRASRVARAMVDRGMEVTLVTGGMPVPGFPGPGIPNVALPPVAVGDVSFAGLVDAEGRPADAAYMAARQDRLLRAFREALPDVVMLEAFPFGRKQVRAELLALIAAIEATAPRPALVASLRDILQRRSKPSRDEETVDLVQRHFDRVLVHGDPAFAALGDSFPFADRIADKVVYSGLVCPPPPPPAAERFDIILSAGGGAVGAGLVRAGIAAAALMPDIANWLVIAGPNLPQAEFDAATARKPANVTLTRFRQGLASLLTGASLSVSQAGYNTVGDLLQAGVRAVLVPFTGQGETEQADRAERLARLGRVTVVPDADLTGERLAQGIRAALAGPDPARVAVLTGGAARSAEILDNLIRSRQTSIT
ncbi:MAG: glycosyltransferase family protein [Gemmobacter sp.]